MYVYKRIYVCLNEQGWLIFSFVNVFIQLAYPLIIMLANNSIFPSLCINIITFNDRIERIY